MRGFTPAIPEEPTFDYNLSLFPSYNYQSGVNPYLTIGLSLLENINKKDKN
jgi:hypothetical protein